MVQSKALRLEWLPAVALSSALAALMLAWNPQVGDLAAQVFRTELFKHAGLAIWNGSWYGGHYTLTYSVLFPPLASVIGPQAVGLLAVVASSYFFDRLVRDHWGPAARPATLWFAAGVVTLLADGQLTFALGVAFGLASLRALQLGRSKSALATAACCALSSPVAAGFLAGVVVAGSLAQRRSPARRQFAAQSHRASRTALWVTGIALALTILPNLAFPESGQFPFAFSSFVAIPLWCGSALYVTRGLGEEERELRWVLAGYLAVSAVLWLAPNPMGGNAVRLGALFGGPVLGAVVLARRPRVSVWVLALVMAAGLYWQLTASVSQIARSVGDPSTSASYFQPLTSWLREHGGAGVRVEVPPTANHWESAYLAPALRAGAGLAAAARHHPRRHLLQRRRGADRPRLQRLAAPQRDLLRRSSRRPARLLLGRRATADPERPVLSEAASGSSAHWRIYAVRDSEPLVDPMGASRARTLWVGRQSFGLDVTRPGDFLVRVNFTPYWSIDRGSGCLLRRGEWTLARASHPGILRVSADFSLGRRGMR